MPERRSQRRPASTSKQDRKGIGTTSAKPPGLVVLCPSLRPHQRADPVEFETTPSEFQKTRVRDACEGERNPTAITTTGKGGVAELVALVERMAAELRSVNQILAAVRAFNERSATTPQAASVWLASDSPEGLAWSAYRGKSPPMDKRGGWRFPNR